jgi:hypothetical protein
VTARRRPSAGVAAAVLTSSALTLCTTGCLNLANAAPKPSAPAAGTSSQPAAVTRPAWKTTCPDVTWTPPASLDLAKSSRELVGYGPTLLGIDTTWTSPQGFTVEAVAGGYMDDITEPYDDLAQTGTLQLPKAQADVLRGSLQDTRVMVVLWRDTTIQAPCDVQALLVIGADPATEDLVLHGLS